MTKRTPQRPPFTPGLLVTAFLCTLLAGCGVGKTSVLFVTSTSFALDFDSKPPVLHLGYSRQEGTLAPVVEGGHVLPQMTSFRFNAGAGQSTPAQGGGSAGVRAGIGQSFATGNAAVLLSKYIGTNAHPDNVRDVIPEAEVNATPFVEETIRDDGSAPPRRRYFFGTDTTLGLKVTMSAETGGYPDSFVLGWKRKELAFVPLIEKRDGPKQQIALPSLIATVGLATSATAGSASAVLNQFYATGIAANYLAAQPGIREEIGIKVMADKDYKAAVKGLQADIQDVRTQDRAFSRKAATLIDRVGADKIDAAVQLAISDRLMSESDRASAGSDLDAKRGYLKNIARAGDDPKMLSNLKKFVDDLEALVGGGG